MNPAPKERRRVVKEWLAAGECRRPDEAEHDPEPELAPAGTRDTPMLADVGEHIWDTTITLAPTLTAALGLSPKNKKPLDGRNLWPQIAEGKTVPREPLFFAVKSLKLP